MAEHLTMERSGEITLPEAVRDRYRFAPGASIRMLETRNGILLVPLTDEPMPEEFARELEEWQSLSVEAWQIFPYEDEPAK